jgi:hypothetical protein
MLLDITICGQIGNETNKNHLMPAKLNHEKKFIDIISHWREDISIALSFDNIYYVWGECNEKYVSKPNETTFKSINEMFNQYCGYDLETSSQLSEFGDLFFRNG